MLPNIKHIFTLVLVFTVLFKSVDFSFLEDVFVIVVLSDALSTQNAIDDVTQRTYDVTRMTNDVTWSPCYKHITDVIKEICVQTNVRN